MQAQSLILPVLLLLSGCAHGPEALYGTYRITGEGGKMSSPPSATLEIAPPNRYRFCEPVRCSNGTFTLLEIPDADHGRINFAGVQIEAYVLGISAGAYGLNEIDRQRGIQRSIELDYTVSVLGTEIPLGVGSFSFVKR